MIIWTDPPKHTTLRKLCPRAFTARRVSELDERIRHQSPASCSTHGSSASGRFDYVQDFAAPLPPTVISTLLGVPESDREHLRHQVDGIFAIDEHGCACPRGRHRVAAEVFGRYLSTSSRSARHPR